MGATYNPAITLDTLIISIDTGGRGGGGGDYTVCPILLDLSKQSSLHSNWTHLQNYWVDLYTFLKLAQASNSSLESHFTVI